jgi:hypothetical protein
MSPGVACVRTRTWGPESKSPVLCSLRQETQLRQLDAAGRRRRFGRCRWLARIHDTLNPLHRRGEAAVQVARGQTRTRAAERQALKLEKARRGDPRAVDYGGSAGSTPPAASPCSRRTT